jgi:ribonuclease PH
VIKRKSEQKAVTRPDKRTPDALRPVSIEIGVLRHPEGSALYTCGGTKVLLSASVESGVKDFLKGRNSGWITAEYAMHPRANRERQPREGRRGVLGGRTQEIQRLIGRALRAVVRLDRLGERTITVDCDVLDADGGTRTACITGAYVALVAALDVLRQRRVVPEGVIREPIAAVSAALVEGVPILDPCYQEDRQAQIDLNLVATASGSVVEVQGTAENEPVPRIQFSTLIDLAMSGTSHLIAVQTEAIQKADIEIERLLGQ